MARNGSMTRDWLEQTIMIYSLSAEMIDWNSDLDFENFPCPIPDCVGMSLCSLFVWPLYRTLNRAILDGCSGKLMVGRFIAVDIHIDPYLWIMFIQPSKVRSRKRTDDVGLRNNANSLKILPIPDTLENLASNRPCAIDEGGTDHSSKKIHLL